MISQSQWPCGLRHELFSLARTLGSWVWISLKAWMSVLCEFILFFLCVGCSLVMGWSPVQGVLLLCIGSRNWKSGQGPTKGCRAIIIIIVFMIKSNMGLCVPANVSLICYFCLPRLYVQNCSNVFNSWPFFSMWSTSGVSLIVLYACPVSVLGIHWFLFICFCGLNVFFESYFECLSSYQLYP
jgi:hypothetical protein